MCQETKSWSERHSDGTAALMNEQHEMPDERIPKSVDTALRALLELCIDKFFRSWHDEQCDCTALTLEIRRLVRHVVIVLHRHVHRFDLRCLVFDRLLPLMMVHFGRYCQVRGSLPPDASCADVEELILNSMASGLHPAIGCNENELRYQRNVASLVARFCFRDIDEWSDSASIFLRELISFGFLSPLVDTVTDVACLNRLLCGLLSPDVDLGPSDPCDVPLLAAFSEDQPEAVLPTLTLQEVLDDQPTFFAFMTFLKAERGPLMLVQFLLSARQVLEKLSSGRDLRDSREDMAHVHWEAWELYRNYLHDCAEQRLDGVPDDLVTAVRKAVEADWHDFPERILKPLCTVYDTVYSILEDGCMRPFCASLYFFDVLFGEVSFEISTRTDEEQTEENSPDLFKEDADHLSQFSLDSSSSSNEEVSSCTMKDIYDLDEALLVPRDMSTWKAHVPRVEPRREPQTDRTTYVYVVEVCRTLADETKEEEGCYMLQWTVDRQYHEFYALEAKLIEFHGEEILKGFPLPPKKSVRAKPRMFVVSWRATFDQFLKRLVANPMLKNSELLFTFLTVREELNFNMLPDPIKAMRKVPVRLQRERGQHLASFMQSLVSCCMTEKLQSLRSRASVDSLFTECCSSIGQSSWQRSLPDLAEHNDVCGNGDLEYLRSRRLSFARNFDMIFYFLYKVFDMNYVVCCVAYFMRYMCSGLLESIFRRLSQRKLDAWLHSKQIAQCIGLLREVVAMSDADVNSSETACAQLTEFTRLRMQEFAAHEYAVLRLLISHGSLVNGVNLLHECLQCHRLNKQLFYTLFDTVLSFFFSDFMTPGQSTSEFAGANDADAVVQTSQRVLESRPSIPQI